LSSVITIISDYGLGSHYAAAIAGKAASLLPTSRFIPLTHQLETFDITGAAFYLRQVYQEYPPGTWNIIGVDSNIVLHKQFLVIKANNQFFIGADNGIFSILFDNFPDEVWKISAQLYSENELFAEKNVFLPFIAKYLQSNSFSGIAEPGLVQNIKKSLVPVIESDGKIIGTILLVDNYQNGISNISRQLFEEKRAGRKFKVFYINRHFIDKISTHYHEGQEGDDLLLFNEMDLLEIAIYRGRGAQLLGLRKGSNIIIEFY